MTQNLLSSLITDTWSDLRVPGLLWQIASIAFSIAAGWALTRLLRGKLMARDARTRMARLGVESFVRVLSPLIALVLMAIATLILAQWYRVNLMRVAIPLVASFALIRLTFYVLRRAFAQGKGAGGFLLTFEKIFAGVVWIGVALYITGLWPDLLEYMEQTALPMGRNKVSLLTASQAAVSVIITLLVALWAGALLEERLMRMSGVHSSLRVVMARMARALFILVAVLLSLSLVGIDLTVLSVFGGALGVGLGLGLQKIASSYVSGFVILLERSLSIGDMVTVDQYSGLITQINTRYTIVRSPDGIETVVPNEMLVSGPVQNYSLTDRSLRLATRLMLPYQTDIERILSLLEQAAAGVARVSREPAPQTFLLRFDSDGFELEVGFWISDPENGRANVLSEVNRAIWKTLQKHGIEVPRSQRDIRLVDALDTNKNAISELTRTVKAP